MLKPIQAQILGAAILEILNGRLTDETIAAVDSIQCQDLPEPLRDVVGYMHGMSTLPQLRHSIIKDLLVELSAGCKALADKMGKNVPPGSFYTFQY